MKTLKKTLSLILSVCIVASMACVAAVTVSANADDPIHSRLITDVVNSEADNQVETETYYFYMPTSWRNNYNDYYKYNPETKTFDSEGYFAAGLYWWDGPYNCNDYKGDLTQGWPGYAVVETDPGDANIFKAEVPKTAGKMIWSNLVDGGMDDTQPFYSASTQTMDIQHEYYDPNEDGYGFYPDGIPEEEGFGGKIFVVNPKAYEENPLTHRFTYKGVWMYYYGNGEYGIYKTRDEAAANNGVLKNGEFPKYGFDVNYKEVEVEVGASEKVTPNDATATATIADPSIASITTADDGSVTVTGVKAGTTTLKFTLDKNGEVETIDVPVTVKAKPAPVVTKKANPMKVTAKNKTYKASKLKKKAQSYKAVTVSKAQGKVTYKVTKKNSKLTFKSGKVTVKKKTKKGTYKIKVKVTAAGNSKYKSASKTVTITVKVKK